MTSTLRIGADGAGLPRSGDGGESDHRAGFAQAVSFEERDGETGGELAQGFPRQGRAAADADAQGQFERAGTVREGAEKLRHRRQEGGPVLDDFDDDVFGRMQGFDEHDGAADQHGQEQADGEHETVKHRQQHRKAVFPHRPKLVPATVNVGQEVAVREHCAFRMAGRARCVDDDRQNFFGHFRRGQGEFAGSKRFHGKRLERRPFRGQRGETVVHRLIQDNDVDAGVGEDELDFGRFEEIVDGHGDRAGLPDAEERRDELRAVLEPGGDPSPGRTPSCERKCSATQCDCARKWP